METQMLTVNEQLSGDDPNTTIGDSKFLVVLESQDREELDSPEAKKMAIAVAGRNGYTGGLATINPDINAVDAETDKVIDSLNVPNIKCYRAHFVVAKRL
jgi:hypothetical protein